MQVSFSSVGVLNMVNVLSSIEFLSCLSQYFAMDTAGDITDEEECWE